LPKKKPSSWPKKVRDSIIAGADFDEFAKRYSDDKMTASDGGNLGWINKGRLYPEFENAAFKLAEGETSLPVETPFGFHIIRTLEKRADAVKTKHILFRIGQSTDDRHRVKKELLEIREKALAGEDFNDLAQKIFRRQHDQGVWRKHWQIAC
jgi:peptidyl-prolyl cis-trans isomerase SurA